MVKRKELCKRNIKKRNIFKTIAILTGKWYNYVDYKRFKEAF